MVSKKPNLNRVKCKYIQHLMLCMFENKTTSASNWKAIRDYKTGRQSARRKKGNFLALKGLRVKCFFASQSNFIVMALLISKNKTNMLPVFERIWTVTLKPSKGVTVRSRKYHKLSVIWIIRREENIFYWHCILTDACERSLHSKIMLITSDSWMISPLIRHS